MEGLNSNLNLNADAPPAVQPRIGEWGPQHVPSTKSKKRARWWAIAIFVLVLIVLCAYGYWIYTMLV